MDPPGAIDTVGSVNDNAFWHELPLGVDWLARDEVRIYSYKAKNRVGEGLA